MPSFRVFLLPSWEKRRDTRHRDHDHDDDDDDNDNDKRIGQYSRFICMYINSIFYTRIVSAGHT